MYEENTSYLNLPLEIKELNIIVVELPLHEVFKSAIGERYTKKTLLIKTVDINGNIGYGEDSSRIDPYYSHEFLDACIIVVEQFLKPKILNNDNLTLKALLMELNKIKGWNFIKSAILDAILNMLFLSKDLNILKKNNHSNHDSVRVGISLGIYSEIDTLLEKVDEAVNKGYQRIKLKIAPNMDLDYFRTLRKYYPEIKLLLDANTSFGENDFKLLKELSKLNLIAIEQPFKADRLDLATSLRKKVPNLRICLDEGISSIGHLYSAIELKSLDEVNIKIGRVGGLINAMHINNICIQNHIPTWIGGMFETGIGRINNLRFASYLSEKSIHDISPSSRYFKEDISSDKIIMNSKGQINTPLMPPSIDMDQLDKYIVQHHESN